MPSCNAENVSADATPQDIKDSDAVSTCALFTSKASPNLPSASICGSIVAASIPGTSNPVVSGISIGATSAVYFSRLISAASVFFEFSFLCCISSNANSCSSSIFIKSFIDSASLSIASLFALASAANLFFFSAAVSAASP